MTRLAVFPLLLLLLPLTTGCLAFAAGAAGGAMANSRSDAVQRYIDTHEVEPRIAEAMYDGEIVEGMTKEQVNFMLGLKGDQWTCEKTETQENMSEWICEDKDPMHVGTYVFRFKDGKVVDSELP